METIREKEKGNISYRILSVYIHVELTRTRKTERELEIPTSIASTIILPARLLYTTILEAQHVPRPRSNTPRSSTNLATISRSQIYIYIHTHTHTFTERNKEKDIEKLKRKRKRTTPAHILGKR